MSTTYSMFVKSLLIMPLLVPIMALPNSFAEADERAKHTLSIAQSFLDAAGSGDKDTLSALMSDDFVWHNEGDKSIPWIGSWKGRDTVLNTFLPAFGAGLKITSWTTNFSFANADQAIFTGTMSGITTKSGIDTGTFSWAVRVHVQEDKVKSWNWFEDSYALSKAYNSQ